MRADEPDLDMQPGFAVRQQRGGNIAVSLRMHRGEPVFTFHLHPREARLMGQWLLDSADNDANNVVMGPRVYEALMPEAADDG